MDSDGVDRSETRFSAAVVASGQSAVVDMSGVTFLASMGVRLFIMSARALSLKGAGMAIYGANELVQAVLDNVALDQIIPVVATREEAIRKLSA